MVNIKKTLEHFEVAFTESHPSVSKNCIGIDCPYCNDNNKHVGIFLDSGCFYCWKCQAKGSLFKLIQKIKGISWDEYSNYTGKSYQSGSVKRNLDSIFKGEIKTPPSESEPETFASLKPQAKEMDELSEKQRTFVDEYLQARGFSYITAAWHCCLLGLVGKYQGRLIIPINPYRIGVEGFVARDITDTAESKYIFPKGFKAHDTIYQVSSLQFCEKKIVIIVEGIFDVWAVESVNHVGFGIFGKNLSDAQLNKIINITPDDYQIIIMLDGDTNISDSVKICNKLSPFFKNIKICMLGYDTDPASMESEELEKCILRTSKSQVNNKP